MRASHTFSYILLLIFFEMANKNGDHFVDSMTADPHCGLYFFTMAS